MPVSLLTVKSKHFSKKNDCIETKELIFRSNLFSEIYDFTDAHLRKILRIWH